MTTSSKVLRVLVACEFSGAVRRAFRALGHDAWSCDLLPAADGSEFHLEGDVLPWLSGMDGQRWDLLIAFPPCTYLCSSGMHWTSRGLRDPQLTEDALAFVQALMDAPIPHIAIENPVGAISTRIRPYDQKVQPWQFGHDASKGTCLWLDNLPPLRHTKVVPPAGWEVVKFAADMIDEEGQEAWCEEHQMDFADCDCLGPTQDGVEYAERDGYLFGRLESETAKGVKLIWGNQTPSGQNKLGPSADRWALRSQTYEGLAAAMAAQWTHYILCLSQSPVKAKGAKGQRAKGAKGVDFARNGQVRAAETGQKPWD
jgi:hypothetical protein